MLVIHARDILQYINATTLLECLVSFKGGTISNMVGVHRFIEIRDQLLLVSILLFLNKTKLTGWQLNWLLDHTKDMVIPPEIGP